MGDLALVLVTAPAEEPVTTAEAKSHLRVDIADDDGLIDDLVSGCREQVENHTRRALVTQTWDLFFDAWPAGDILIPRPPLQSVTGVYYTNDEGVETQVSSSIYLVDVKREPGRVVLKSGESWPSATLQGINGVRVRFVAGYGAAAAVPGPIKSALKLWLGDLYENRENTLIGIGTAVVEMPFAARALLSPYRNWRWPSS